MVQGLGEGREKAAWGGQRKESRQAMCGLAWGEDYMENYVSQECQFSPPIPRTTTCQS